MMDETVTCSLVRSSLWEIAAQESNVAPIPEFAVHLESCRNCRREQNDVLALRGGLKSLPRHSVTPLLATKLRVLASRESSRRRRHRSFEARWNEFVVNAKLVFDNLLRPIAVPAAGGLLSSVFCFGLMLNTFHIGPVRQNDIPVGLFTQVMLNDVSPFYSSGGDVIVQLTIDADGRVSDFTVPEGAATPEELQEIGNLVLYSTFTPATAFGQRVAGKVLVSIQHINVPG